MPVQMLRQLPSALGGSILSQPRRRGERRVAPLGSHRLRLPSPRFPACHSRQPAPEHWLPSGALGMYPTPLAFRGGRLLTVYKPPAFEQSHCSICSSSSMYAQGTNSNVSSAMLSDGQECVPFSGPLVHWTRLSSLISC